MRNGFLAIMALGLLVSAAFASLANAADHRDSSLNVSNPTADINDVFAFRSPTNPDNLVIAISVNPLIVPSDNLTRGVFDDGVTYQIHVDLDGDLIDDATVSIRKDGGSDANSGTIKTWVSTSRDGRVDRMAIPAINTALIHSEMKDAFNQGDPVNDAADFQPAAIATIDFLREVVDGLFGVPQDGGPLGDLTSAQVGAALVPDVVTIDFSQPLAFPNGRQLEDDVIDAALGVVLNRGGAAGIGDGVDANDKPFSTTFPYLAEPHSAASMTPPSTGDAGLIDSGTGWTLSLAFLLVAVTFGGLALASAARAHAR